MWINMKGLEKLSTLFKIGTSILDEFKKSEDLVEAKSDLKEDLDKIKNIEFPEGITKHLFAYKDAKRKAKEEMLNSDEVNFIKEAVTNSDAGKKVAEINEKVEDALDTLKRDILPFPLVREYTNYKYWKRNYRTMLDEIKRVDPLTLITYFLKYPWLFEYTKANNMVYRTQIGRTGNNFFLMHEELNYVIRAQAHCIVNAMLYPERTIYIQNVTFSEIIQAMGLNFQPVEIGTLICKLDQWSITPYLEAGEAVGLAADTCGLPKSSLGLALRDEILPAAAFLTSNYPCDGGLAAYSGLSDLTGLPVYRYNMPYDLRSEEAADRLVDDLKESIVWLEENTPGKMDWDELTAICERYNKMAEIEYERWEMTKLDNTPLSNDPLQQCHYYNFSFLSALPFTYPHHRKMYEMNKRDLAKGRPSFDGFRYRVVMWNPAPSAWGQWYHWLEQCWGIGILMDIESIGTMWHIDTSSKDSILRGLAKRQLWQTMAKHTKGPASNYFNDLIDAIDGWRPDFVLLPKPVGCKNVMSMEALVRDICKERDIPLCTFSMELQDNRVATRQQMREPINRFMQDVMQAEPLDPTMLHLDDSDSDKW